MRGPGPSPLFSAGSAPCPPAGSAASGPCAAAARGCLSQPRLRGAAAGRAAAAAAHRCMTPWRCRCAMPRQSWYMKFWTRGFASGFDGPRPVASMNFFRSVSKYSKTCGQHGSAGRGRACCRDAAHGGRAHQVKHRLAVLLDVLHVQKPRRRETAPWVGRGAGAAREMPEGRKSPGQNQFKGGRINGGYRDST